MPAQHRGSDTLTTGLSLCDRLPGIEVLLVAGPGPDVDSAHRIDDLVRSHAGQQHRPVDLQPDDPLSLVASSGTTSTRPKICIHTHGGQLGNAAAVAATGKARPDDTLVSASPFTHLFGLLSIHLSLVAGGRQALLPHWSAAALVEIAGGSEATVLFAVPAQLRDLLEHLDEQPQQRLRLREIRTGGAPVPTELVRSIEGVLGGGVAVQWGMSEVGAGTFTRPGDPIEAVTRSIGRPVPGAEARIVAGDDSEVPDGETGELCYRAASMFRGYLGDPARTREAVSDDGWLPTGDLAGRNPDGNIAYRGRRTEFINRGGMKFSAVEVENLLSEIPSLAQYAVVGREDDRLGQRSCLIAVPREGAVVTLEDVTAHLARKGLARFKWPEELILVEEIPSTPTGKTARGRLGEILRSASPT